MAISIQTLTGVASATPAGLPAVAALMAGGDTFTDPAIAAIANGQHVYIDSQASLSNANQINSQLQNGATVVALPNEAFSSFDESGLATQISAATGNHTVIVVNSSLGRVGVAGPGSVAVLTKVNTEIGNGKAPGDAIASSVSTINAASAGHVASTAQNPNTGGDSGVPLVGIGGGLVGVLAVAAAAIAIARSRRSRGQSGRMISSNEMKQTYIPPVKFSKYLPESLQNLVKQMDDLARKHSKVAGDPLAPQISKIITNLQELFNRIHKQNDGNNNAGLAEVEYKDKLEKLIEALGPDYYLYIEAKPDMWDKPQERMKAVEDAVDSVEYELVENIRQVNASKDLKFQVALDSLMGSKAPKVQDLYKSNDEKEDDK